MKTLPAWRSLLFIPANNPRIIEGAHKRGADAVIVDLEDAVPGPEKEQARAGLAETVARLKEHQLDVIIRINADPDNLRADIRACILPGIQALMLPKVETAADILYLNEQISHYASGGNLLPVIALIESPKALFNLAQIAAAPQVIGLALGSEDLSLALGVPSAPACLTLPCQMLALAAAAEGLISIGLPDSLGEFRDMERLTQAAQQARSYGIQGALCIHPAQVPVMNQVFSPSSLELEWAASVMAAWEEAGQNNLGVVSLNGKMIDLPVVLRASKLLNAAARHQLSTSISQDIK